MSKLTAGDVYCPTCNARPGYGCKTKTGWGARMHATRFKAVGVPEDHEARMAAWSVIEKAETERRARMMALSDAGRAALQQKGEAG